MKTDRTEVKSPNNSGEYTYWIWSYGVDLEYRESNVLKWKVIGDVPRDPRRANIGQYNIDVITVEEKTKIEKTSGSIIKHSLGMVDLVLSSTILECKFPPNSSENDKFSQICGAVLIDLIHFEAYKPRRLSND
jgi:hypothetical protein